MDPVSLAVGIPGLIQSCVHGYRLVAEMLALDSNIKILRLRCRVEECRLHLWGRFWNLLDEQSNVTTGHSQGRFDDLLELPGIEKLIIDILTQIKQILEKTQKLSDRYSDKSITGSAVATSTPAQTSSETTVATTSTPPATSSSQQNTKSSHGIPIRLRWVLKDKNAFGDTLNTLTSLNDGLEKLLPRRERVSLERALVGELLAEPSLAPGSEGKDELTMAMGTTREDEDPENDQQQQQDDRTTPQEPSSADHNNDQDNPVEESMMLPLEWFPHLQGQTRGRSVQWFHPPKDSKIGKVLQQEDMELSLVEWRLYSPSVDSKRLQMALEARREEIARLFHYESTKSSDHYVLPCLGYLVIPNECVGFVFQIPKGCQPHPISLYEVMELDYSSMTSIPPSLDVRFKLARKLSLALYQLQCAGWMHRQISSHNILFFGVRTDDGIVSSTRESINLMRPFITGWQTARGDDQRKSQATETQGTIMFEEHEYFYIHPNRPNTRFKRSYDVYSLGVVLAEIAFWEPTSVLGGGRYMISDRIYGMAEKELAAEVGNRYRGAVLWCLKGLFDWQLETFAAKTAATEEEFEREIGVEKEFFWRVLNELDMGNVGHGVGC